MKHYRIFLAITVLVFASLACQTLMGGRDGTATEAPSVPSEPDIKQAEPTVALPESNDNGNNDNGSDGAVVSTDFPMTDDAFNVTEVGGTLLYYTKMSLEDVMEFYRDEYTAKGYTEREILTTVSDGIFSMVFDGDPSGKAVIIQSVDLGDGSRTVTIVLEDV